MVDEELKDIPITRLIPQRKPFVMVDRILSCDMVDAYTELLVQADNIFLDEGELSAAGIMEHLAQSCAARMGCINRMRGESIKIGYIGDMRNYVIYRHPKEEELISTHVHILEDVFHLTLAEVTAWVDNEEIASVRMKIALTDMDAEPAEV